jgi:transglutaminase-like putative cysteine protease
VNHQQDPYGNWLARFVFPEPVTEFKIEVDLVADMTVYNPFDFFVEERRRTGRSTMTPTEATTCHLPDAGGRPARCCRPSWTSTCRGSATRTVDFLVDLNARLSQEIGYVIRMEPGVQTPEETLERGKGSCRDTAGCWCRSCAISASPRASSPAT